MKYKIIKTENEKIIFEIIQMSKDGLAITIAKWFRQETIGL